MGKRELRKTERLETNTIFQITLFIGRLGLTVKYNIKFSRKQTGCELD
jgi:hypothetical protein